MEIITGNDNSKEQLDNACAIYIYLTEHPEGNQTRKTQQESASFWQCIPTRPSHCYTHNPISCAPESLRVRLPRRSQVPPSSPHG